MNGLSNNIAVSSGRCEEAMTSRAELVVKYNEMYDKYLKAGEDLEDVRRLFEQGISKLLDIEKEFKKGWGYKKQ